MNEHAVGFAVVAAVAAVTSFVASLLCISSSAGHLAPPRPLLVLSRLPGLHQTAPGHLAGITKEAG